MQACVPAFAQKGGSSASTLSSVVLGPAILGQRIDREQPRIIFVVRCDAEGIYLFFRNRNSFQCDAGESIRPRDVPGMLARHQGRSQIWGQSCPSFVRISGPRHYCCNFDPCSVLIWRVFMSCFKGRAQAGPAASNSSILASVHAAILIPLQC